MGFSPRPGTFESYGGFLGGAFPWLDFLEFLWHLRTYGQNYSAVPAMMQHNL